MVGQQFNTNEEVMQVMQSWLHSQPKEFFNAGIHKLPERWTKCNAKQEQYMEK
jgi:hypothetical protein